MSHNGKNVPSAPSAPPGSFDLLNDFAMRAPPPSYEESQRMIQHPTAAVQPTQFYGMVGHRQMQAAAPPPPPPAYGYTNPYQTHMLQQQQYYSAGVGPAPMTSGHVPSTTSQPPVLALAKGAVVRTTLSGAVSIPPPPPGCAPTPAQLAAMQGQKVMIKTKKNSFF